MFQSKLEVPRLTLRCLQTWFPQTCIHENYNLKGSSKGRNDLKKMIYDKSMLKDRDFNLIFYIDPLYRTQLLAPGLKLGYKVLARAVHSKGNEAESLSLHKCVKAKEHQIADIYFAIVDTLQHYSMTKRTEHAYKSLQYDSKSIPTVNPKTYSSRFQEFMSNIFRAEESED